MSPQPDGGTALAESGSGATSRRPTSARFLISVHHPAQVHFYRSIVEQLRARGHRVRVCARDKEITADLLSAYDIPHRILADDGDSLPATALGQAVYELRLLREARRFQPDVLTSIGGIEISHVAPLVGARTVAFDDTGATVSRLLTVPALDLVCTPAGFDRPVRGRRRTYDGYHELAYLHPRRFDPDRSALRTHGVKPEESYYVLRFAAWEAYHDVGASGLSAASKHRLVELLSERGTVYISSERSLPAAFQEYEVPVPPHRMHDLLAFADLYAGDSGTMATEAAVLATPAVRANSTVGPEDCANFRELETEYGLLYSFADESAALERIVSLVDAPDTATTWRHNRDRLLAEKIDVASFAVDQLETLASTGRKTSRTKHNSAETDTW